MSSHLLINQTESDIDTNNSSFQQFDDFNFENKIQNTISVLSKYSTKLIQYGFSKILCKLALFRPQKVQKFIKRAQICFYNQQYNQSFQLASLALDWSEKHNEILYERSAIILFEISIVNRNIEFAQVFLHKLSILKQRYQQKRFLLLKLKFYVLTQEETSLLNCLDQLQIYMGKRCMSQQPQLIIIYCQYCIQMNMDFKAFQKLQAFLPQIIRRKSDQSANIAKIYLLLAHIQRRKQNHQKQWCHLVCASFTIQRKFIQTEILIQIQCKKLKNLIHRNLHQKAYQLLQSLLSKVPEKLLYKSSQLMELQQMCKILNKNNNKMSEKQIKLCQLNLLQGVELYQPRNQAAWLLNEQQKMALYQI